MKVYQHIIIGGGIAGLATLERLKKEGVDQLLLLEKEGECGGLVRTSFEDNYLCETGPNAFLKSYANTRQLIKDIGLEEEIISNNPDSSHRFIYRDGKLHPIPEGPVAFFKTSLFSWRAKLRLLLEPFIKSSELPEESIDQFAKRRFGAEISSIVLDAMVSGVCAGDHRKLDIHSLFPKISLVEKKVRSFLLFLLIFKFKNTGKAKSVNFYSLKKGMGSIAKKIFERNREQINTQTPVKKISRENDLYKIESDNEVFWTENITLAAAANVASRLVEDLSPQLAQKLAKIPYCSITTCLLGYQRKQVEHKMNGFGFLIPRNQGKRILGGLFSSSLFSERAPEGMASIKVYIGGAHDPQINQMNEEEILNIILEEIEPILSISGKPTFAKINKIQNAIPQYNLGHQKVKEQIAQELVQLKGITLVGNYLHGISVNEAIKEH